MVVMEHREAVSKVLFCCSQKEKQQPVLWMVLRGLHGNHWNSSANTPSSEEVPIMPQADLLLFAHQLYPLNRLQGQFRTVFCIVYSGMHIFFAAGSAASYSTPKPAYMQNTTHLRSWCHKLFSGFVYKLDFSSKKMSKPSQHIIII